MFARRIWSLIETVHAVTYFAPESRESAKDAGLKGFWMGYFGFRACPLGPVGAGVVEAAFANFAPSMVHKYVPDLWSHADPAQLATVRAVAAAKALRQRSSTIEHVALSVNDDFEAVIASGSSLGLPLFTANRTLKACEDPVERLWQNCTTLREHRGDGHVATLATEQITGPQAHLLLAAEYHWDPNVFFDNRGWTAHDRAAAHIELVEAGLLDGSGLTPKGQGLRSRIENMTDTLAGRPYELALSNEHQLHLITVLSPIAADIINSGVIPFPNPIGLTNPNR